MGPYFRPGSRLLHKGVVLGDGVVLSLILVINIDSQDLAKQLAQVLPVIEWIIGGSAVAYGHIQVFVGPEAYRPAVVVPKRLLDTQQFFLGRGIGPVRVVRPDSE